MSVPRLELLREGRAVGEVPLDGELVIGRGSGGDTLFAGDKQMSRRHARITHGRGDALILEDLGSTNGTLLNGWQIPSPQVLAPGDLIQIGATVIRVVGSAGTGAEAPARPSAIVRGIAGYEELRPEQSRSTLYVDGLRKSYGEREILKGVDLEVQPGEILGLLGANGAGKTTLVSIIAGLRPASGGTVHVAGIDALARPLEARRALGLAPQDLGIYQTLTVRRNLQFFGELAGLRGSELDRAVEDVGNALSLTEMFDRRAAILSGGQKRRLHTGMAMIHGPALLMLDEPTVGADIRTRTEILDLVKRLAADGRSVVYSTHYLPEIEELGASVAMLVDGQIIARGSIAELVANYSTTAVELQFDGPAPELSLPYETQVDENVLRVTTDAPAETAAWITGRLGAYAAHVRAIEVIRPSLDSVYLKLTERRYSRVQQQVPPEAVDAPAGDTAGRGVLPAGSLAAPPTRR